MKLLQKVHASPMFSNMVMQRRKFGLTPKNCVKVLVVGAAGNVGKSLSLLLKLSTIIKELRLYDINNTPAITADLSDIESPVKVRGFIGREESPEAFKGNFLFFNRSLF